MTQSTHPFIPFGAGDLPSSSIQADPVSRGATYLRWLQSLALEPAMIAIPPHPEHRVQMCRWIGNHVSALNEQLLTYVAGCQACFHPEDRQSIQVFAAPLNPNYRVDAVCNVLNNPTTILIDTGRVVSQDWLKLVAHEVAHAQLGVPGHDERFRDIMTHLCLGLGLEPPPASLSETRLLRQWPPCQPAPDPHALWLHG